MAYLPGSRWARWSPWGFLNGNVSECFKHRWRDGDDAMQSKQRRRREGRTRARQIAAAAGIDGDDEVNNERDGNIPEVLLVLGPPLVVGELDLLRSI